MGIIGESKTAKPLESLCGPLREIRDGGVCRFNVFHDEVRHSVIWGEKVANAGNAGCARIAGCEFGEVLLCLVLRVQGLVVAKFDKEPFENHAASVVLLWLMTTLVFFAEPNDLRPVEDRTLCRTARRGVLDEDV